VPEPSTAPTTTPVLPDPLPRRLNLGCGWDKRDGYLNVDLHGFHDPDLVADVRDLAMLADATFDEVVAQDVLEHLARTDGLPALREWARLLVPGGRLVLRVPDLLGLATLLATHTDQDMQETLVTNLFGTQAYNGDFHQNGFTELRLRQHLHDAGFDVAEVTHADGWLFDVVAVRTDTPTPARLADCGYMGQPLSAVAAGASGPVSDALDDARSALEQARAHAAVDGVDAGATRLRAPKSALLRLLRVHTHRQAAHNEAVDAALAALTDAVTHLPR
jgi:predicted SAM-dependent methyltransferase